MGKLGLFSSLAASVSLATAADFFSTSDWGFQQKRILFEAVDHRGFPYLVPKSSALCIATEAALNDLKKLNAGPDTMSDVSDLTRHIFISCTRDGNVLSSTGLGRWNIGFPLFFLNSDVDKVNKAAVKLRHSFTYLWARRNKQDEYTVHTFERKPLSDSQWNSDAGQELLKSLTTPASHSLKFFAARQLLLVARANYDAHVNAASCGSVPLLIYLIGRFLKSSLRQPVARGTSIFLYGISTALVSAGAITALDFRRCSIERNVDTKAAQLSLDYAEGGIAYYNQLLAQNRALRQLQAEANDWKAAQTVSAIGDPITFIRQKSMPLSARRDVCVSVSEKLLASKTHK